MSRLLASMKTRRAQAGIAAVALSGLITAADYPLDGYEYTGIRRLEAYGLMVQGKMQPPLSLASGARLERSQIRLRMADANAEFDIGADTPRDPALQSGVERIVRARHPSYRVAVLDITDPQSPRYAAVRADEGYIPGSVAKVLVMTGAFDQLRRRFPTDVEARAGLLRSTEIVADDFVMPNSHTVPVVNADMTSVTHRAVRVGDRFSLWEWIDHMVSPSSNAAGAMVWKHAMLMDAFGSEYPMSAEREAEFMRTTPKPELATRSRDALAAPLVAMGLDTAGLKLGTYFTRNAGRVIPGSASYATPNQLVRWLLRVEQGKAVDRWSSLEMKRLMYFTRRRYRYAASPALADAAVYFKSGSLYQCEPEPGYECGQYRGNARNLMHSVAIVESPSGGEGAQRVYLVAMMSNVPKVNSAQAHMEIASEVERLIRDLHSQ